MLDMTESIQARSDQLNADDLLGGPRTFTIAEVNIVGGDQPVHIHLAEFPKGRPWKPSKSERRVLVAAWGKDAAQYVGKRVTLFRNPDVKFGGEAVGGIQISHLSDIAKPMKLALTASKGKKAKRVIDPLPADAPTAAPVDEATVARIAELRAEWHEADEARRAEIEAEVARLQGGESA